VAAETAVQHQHQSGADRRDREQQEADRGKDDERLATSPATEQQEDTGDQA